MSKTITYLESLEPGSFVAEEDHREVTDRDPQRDAAAAGRYVFAFRYYDVLTAEVDGVTTRSAPMNHSGYYYIDAEELSVADVSALNDKGQYDILIRNMESNGWDPILKCRTGNFRPKDDGDTIIHP